MFIGAYWSQREESKEAAARRISVFLKAIGDRFERFGAWYSKARSRSSAQRSPLPIGADTISTKLRVNRRDVDGRPIPELGFGFSAWNGKDVSFSATIGVYSKYVGNSVLLDFTGDDVIALEVSRGLLEDMVRAFDPENAVVTSEEHLAQAGAEKPWRAGWLTYERGGEIQQHALPSSMQASS